MMYYISRGGQQHGPYAMPDLQNMLGLGQIDANDLVWGEGFPSWMAVSQVVTLPQAQAPVQPPAPAPSQPQPQPAPKTQMLTPEELWGPGPEQVTKPLPTPVASPTPKPAHTPATEPTPEPAWMPVAQAPVPTPTPSPAPEPWTPPAQVSSPEPSWAPPAQAPAPQPAAQAAFAMGQPSDFRSANVSRRYKDSYRVAGVIVGLSKVLKVIGIVVAALCLLGSIISFSALPSIEGGGMMKAIVLGYGIFGAIFSWLVFWLWGVVIGALGQLLRANLDEAVHTSPFLNDDQRAEVMGV